MDSLTGDVHAPNGAFLCSSSGSSEFPDILEPFGECAGRKRGFGDSLDLALLPKKPKIEDGSPSAVLNWLLPEPLAVYVAEEGILDVVPISERPLAREVHKPRVPRACKQFWKAGDYEGDSNVGNTNNANNMALCNVGMDYVRVHPRFLHSNATSHKWALGAFAELLDNALDEVCNGATYIHIDVLQNKKDGSKMLVFEDNGGGMTPNKIRQCMSLGYSAKSKMANTIGQYGNGFKTSTMRLGADVLVLSRCQGSNGKSATQSIGMLSYTFLRATRKEDIVVPMVDFEKVGQHYSMMVRSSAHDWHRNLETIIQWSPYMSEADLFEQFRFLGDQGTRIIIYNLWEDDEGNLELDFDADPYDIQLRGDIRDEKNIKMATDYPNSRHFLTYQHSLRSYASILYLRLPSNFRMTLRGKEIVHHNLVNDMMHKNYFVYRPQIVAEKVVKDSDMVANVTVGFVKDAEHHIDVQGFSVYNKNRLIKPFWRVWNAAGSNGRGVIGVLEANFVEPAHDKQGFERTALLSRLEARLVKMQKDYWSNNSHKVGYSGKTSVKRPFSRPKQNGPCSINGGTLFNHDPERQPCLESSPNLHVSAVRVSKLEKMHPSDNSTVVANCHDTTPGLCELNTQSDRMVSFSHSEPVTQEDRQVSTGRDVKVSVKLEQENLALKERLIKMDMELLYRGDKCKSLELQLKDAQEKIEDLDKEQVTVIEMLVDERKHRDEEEERLRKKLREASKTIEDLLNKVRLLESKGFVASKVEC